MLQDMLKATKTSENMVEKTMKDFGLMTAIGQRTTNDFGMVFSLSSSTEGDKGSRISCKTDEIVVIPEGVIPSQRPVRVLLTEFPGPFRTRLEQGWNLEGSRPRIVSEASRTRAICESERTRLLHRMSKDTFECNVSCY